MGVEHREEHELRCKGARISSRTGVHRCRSSAVEAAAEVAALAAAVRAGKRMPAEARRLQVAAGHRGRARTPTCTVASESSSGSGRGTGEVQARTTCGTSACCTPRRRGSRRGRKVLRRRRPGLDRRRFASGEMAVWHPRTRVRDGVPASLQVRRVANSTGPDLLDLGPHRRPERLPRR